MASRPSPDPVEQHRLAQDAIALQLARFIKQIWDSLFPNGVPTPDLLPTFKAQAAAVVAQGALAAQRVGQEFYDANRAAAGVSGSVRPALVAVPTPDQVAAAVDKALEGLSPAADSNILPSELVANALTNVTGAMELQAIDSGRDQSVATTRSDRSAIGFVRIPKPGGCSFCMLMATRGGKGILYKSRETAGEVDASVLWGKDASGTANRYHDGCRCQVVPVYSRNFESPQHVKDAVAVYDSEYVQSFNGKDRANAFRRVYERPLIADEDRRARQAKPKQLVLSQMSRDQIEQQLSVVRTLPESDYRTNQTARLEEALAAVA